MTNRIRQEVLNMLRQKKWPSRKSKHGQDFQNAAPMRKAGFDGVEIHSQRLFVFIRFLMGSSNLEHDEYARERGKQNTFLFLKF